MKTYRKAVADAFVMQNLLTYIAERADDLLSDAEGYRLRSKEHEEGQDGYYLASAVEYEAKSAAFERLLEKLSK